MATQQRAAYGPAAYESVRGGLPAQYPRTMGPNAMKYLREVVDGGLSRHCDMVARFESAFAKELGVKHCIGTPGCTPALACLAAAFDFEPGDEIIVSPITDYGTIQGLVRENYIPVFPDTEPGSVNMNAETIEPCITDRTRAILAVHKTGIICDMDPINELARKHDIIVYEDACQAVFGEYKGRLAGTLALAAGFSFDSEKTMGSDVGGCIVTNDDALAERSRFIGQSRGAVNESGFGRKHVEPGYAYRMPLCTAAICLAQLEIIHEQVAQRDRMVRLLSRLVGEIPGVTPLADPRLPRRLFGLDVRHEHRPRAVHLHDGGVRPAIGRGRHSQRRHGQVLSDARRRHVPSGERRRQGLSLQHAARLARVSLRRRVLPQRLEVPADLDPLGHVLREIHRGRLPAGLPHRKRRRR